MMTEDYMKKLDDCSETLIANDGMTLIQLADVFKQSSILIIAMIPFLAMYCNEAIHFYGDIDANTEALNCVRDIRNQLKYPWDSYNKTVKRFIECDEKENRKYRNIIRFRVLRKMNIHYNLGVYFSENGKLVYNTQIASYYLYATEIEKRDEDLAFTIGKNLGELLPLIVNRALDYLTKAIIVPKSVVAIGHIDYNTNGKKNIFVSQEDKGLNLYLLHLLCMFDSYKYLISTILDDENTFKLRIEYIVSYALWQGLKKITSHFEQNECPSVLDVKKTRIILRKGEVFFSPGMRQAMMHYRLYDKGVPVIDQAYFNPELLYYGLFECVSGGKNIHVYYSELKEYMATVEEYLNSFFVYDIRKIEF